MLFNSYIFIFLFLPITLTGYYVMNYFLPCKSKISNIFLICMSLWFYGYFNSSYLIIICGSILINFLLSKKLSAKYNQSFRKFLLFLGICINIAVIFYFKYYNFFLDNMNVIFKTSFELKNILLPLGISFFTFQQISYLFDSYKGETSSYSFDEYALFVSFFPQLVAGPIVLHNEMIPQFKKIENRQFIPHNFSKGMYIFALGLFKKVIIADTFGKAVSYGFSSIDTISSLEALIVSLSYTFQLFFDFSGYSDMAIGIGYMFNIELPQNFNSPYKSTSILDFWNRWHMSLTRFLKTYIYIPLGGNRKGKLQTYINIMIVYLISGIWHGANWTFVLWGALHGLLNCLNRFFQKYWKKLGNVTQWSITFSLINILWIFFRADSVSSAILFIRRLFSLSSFTIREDFYSCFDLIELSFLENNIQCLNFLSSHIAGFNLWFFIFGAFFIILNFRNSYEITFKPTIKNSFTTVILIVWSVISLTEISTFLYFNF